MCWGGGETGERVSCRKGGWQQQALPVSPVPLGLGGRPPQGADGSLSGIGG